MCPTHIVLCFCFVFIRLVCPMLPVSLDYSFLIAHSVFSQGYLNISVFCFITCGHVRDHKTSLTSPLFIVVSVPTQDGERSYIMVAILPLFLRVSDSVIVVLHFMKMIYFCVIIYPY